jgi:tRNA-specific 2-thiouridylase
MTKDETRLVASEQGFDNAHKKDSQDICFVQDGNYAGFIEDYSSNESPQGDFVDMDGNVLGIHKGIIRYTIGQRKGLGLALPEPMYVCRKDMDNNRVVLGRNDQLFGHTVMAENINLITSESLEGPTRVNAKIRYNQTEQPATVTQTGEDELRIVFDEPQRAIAAGQSVVMYDGDIVVGGGIIR